MQKLILFDIDNTVFNTALFKSSEFATYKAYDEVHKLLEKLKEIALLGIFSEGDQFFQEKKLKETLLDSFFPKERIHIFLDKISELSNVLDNYASNTVFLVDDKLPVLYEAKKLVPSIFTIWVKRGEYANYQDPIDGFAPDAIIVDLRELESIVKSNK